jgi:hypothetical protein
MRELRALALHDDVRLHHMQEMHECVHDVFGIAAGGSVDNMERIHGDSGMIRMSAVMYARKIAQFRSHGMELHDGLFFRAPRKSRKHPTRTRTSILGDEFGEFFGMDAIFLQCPHNRGIVRRQHRFGEGSFIRADDN